MSYDSDVVAATSGRGEANWDQIIKLCNRIRDSIGTTSIHQAMSSVLKRVRHSDPNVQLQALTLLEACVSNCGRTFQLELTQPSFHTEVKAILSGVYSDPRVTQRLKELLVSWSNEFKNDAQMSGLHRFIEQLQREGISFARIQQTPTPTPAGGQSTVLASKEDNDLQKAIRLSLQETQAHSSSSSSSSRPASQAPKKTGKKVRAIYDFMAAEDNEISFRAGEIVDLLDDSDENWWRGQTHQGTGLFPAAFVSKDLNVDPEPSVQQKKEREQKKNKKASGAKKSKGTSGAKKGVVNEQKVDLLLEMLKQADATVENQAETETLQGLEDECRQMKPIVGAQIAALQSQEDEMTQISQKFQEALTVYRRLLAEGPRLSSTPVAPTIPGPPASLPLQQQTLPPSHQPISLPPPRQPASFPPQHPQPAMVAVHPGIVTAQPPRYQPVPASVPGLAPPTGTYSTTSIPPTSVYAPEVTMDPTSMQLPSAYLPSHPSLYQPSSLPQHPSLQQPSSLPPQPSQPQYQQQSVYTQPYQYQVPQHPQVAMGAPPISVAMSNHPQQPPPYQQPLWQPQNASLQQPLL